MVAVRVIPDWDSIRPEKEAKAKRAKEVAARMQELREYKKQGRRYDGERMEEVREVKGLENAGFSQLMNEAEAFFAENKTTSGVGGSWTPPATKEMEEDIHKPKVSTWGRFPRPRDMSKAYGGGRRIGVGVVQNETLAAQKAAETSAKLAAYRIKSGAEQRVVDANKEAIEAAIATAQRATMKGMSQEGVKALRAVEEFCTPRTALGAEALLELALACEGAGEVDAAKAIYAQLVLSPLSDVKRRAKQLSFGFQAQEKLGVESYKDSEAAKMALAAYEMDFSAVNRESKVYVQSVQTKLSTSQRESDPDYTLEEQPDQALDLLRRATIGGESFASPDRVAKALEQLCDGLVALEDEQGVGEEDSEEVALDDEEEMSPSAAPDTASKKDAEMEEEKEKEEATSASAGLEALETLDGEWNVVFAATRGSPRNARYQPEGVSISIDASTRTVSRRIPVLDGLVFVDWRGSVSRTEIDDKSLVAYRTELSPTLFSAFFDDRWLATVSMCDGRLCVIDQEKELLLCKKKRRR